MENENAREQAALQLEMEQKQVEIKKAQLLAKAQSAEVKNTLSDFLAPGNLQPKGG